MTRIRLSDALLKAIKLDGGEVEITVRGKLADFEADREDLDDAAQETFKADVTIDGEAQQMRLDGGKPGSG
jgi:hypothetical protein